MNSQKPTSLQLSDEDQKAIESSVVSIRKVLRKHNVDIKSIVGNLSAADIGNTKSAVEVRFNEETALHVVMNMIAMD